jgi:hypothetical protein
MCVSAAPQAADLKPFRNSDCRRFRRIFSELVAAGVDRTSHCTSRLCAEGHEYYLGARGSLVVETLYYKPEGHRFETR